MNRERELSLLSVRQIKGMTVLQDDKTKKRPTDMAILCGYDRFGTDDCWIYTLDTGNTGKGFVVWNSLSSFSTSTDTESQCYIIRPVLKLSSTLFKKISSFAIIGESGVREVQYGEYPQYAPSSYIQQLLESEYAIGSLIETDDYFILGDDSKCKVFEYCGKRYVRVRSMAVVSTALSNGFTYKTDSNVWVEVSPVTWLVDDNTEMLVAKDGLLSGVTFNHGVYNGNFDNTAVKKYLDTHMLRDLFQSDNLSRKNDMHAQKVYDKIEEISQLLNSIGNMYMAEFHEILSKYNTKSSNDILYDSLLAELDKFLQEKKAMVQKYGEYYKMLVYTRECIKILSGGVLKETKDELLSNISSIRLFDRKISKIDDFMAFFKQCEEDIASYVGGNSDSPIAKYQTFEEFKVAILEQLDKLLAYDNSVGLTILTPEMFSGNKSLSVLKKYGSLSIATDLAILTGADAYYDGDMHGMVGKVFLNSFGSREKSNAVDRYGRSCIIRGNTSSPSIRPAFFAGEMFPQLLAKSTSKYGLLSEVECGEYPQFVPKSKVQSMLSSKHAKGLLKETGRTYTMATHPMGIDRFVPQVFKEYEYKGKKYICISNLNTNYSSVTLSNGMDVGRESEVWVEVTPVVWLIDKETKMLVSKYALISGIPLRGNCHDIAFSEIGMFLGKYMARDIFQSTDMNKSISINNKKVNCYANEKTKKIAILIEEINNMLSTYYGNEDIMGKVEELITKYNRDVDRAYEEENNGVFGVSDSVDVRLLYAKLISDLEDVLSNVKRSSEKYIEYTKMLELTKTCIGILNGNNVEDESDDLIKDIVTIKKVILPFLSDDSKKREVMAIFLESEKAISEYLRGNEDSKIKQYKTLEEYKLGIRKQLQPYLISLSTSVRNKDMVNEIKKGYINMLDGLFVKCKDDYIGYFLTEIKTLIDTISTRGNSAEKQKMKEILANKSDFGDDLTKALTIAVSLYRDLYGVVLDIEKREKKQMEHEQYKIDIRGVNLRK